MASFFAAASVVSITSGSFAERFGGEIIMRICAVVAALSLLGIATIAHSYLTMLILLIVAGLTNGANQPAVNLFVIDAVRPGRRGFALGVKQASIPVATLLAGLAVPFVALTIGWHWAYGFAAIVAIIVAIAIPPGKSRGIAKSSQHTASTRPKIAVAPIVTLTIAMAFGAGAANALGAFLVENAVHAHWSPGNAGLLAALGSAAGLISRLIGGFMADRRGGRHLPVIAAMMGLGALGYASFALGVPWLILPATIVCYGAGWGWNGVFNFAIIVNHPGAEGRATGTTQAGAYIGSVVGPLAFGYVVDHASFAAAWSMTSVAALFGASGILYGRRLLLKNRRKSDASVTIAG